MNQKQSEKENAGTNSSEQGQAGTNENQGAGAWEIPIDQEQICLAYSPTRDYYSNGVGKGLTEESQILQSGESRQCVNVYSYAGPDPYDGTVLSD